ncbi:DUF1467 family protein [Lutibaculum baratangense]|uniref:Uncharacterized protein n=1 Tax=Lutibaculum baratangense AMV1 TaxID=631454 RepID=V4RIG2_9HYPH|nr:DUF1467 family protein [Lutibaculum baratangense]ESR25129.1 hypothetical protein N177_2003 [Lutibaculum baratangense AMV1]
MQLVSAIAVYFIIWWLVFFAVLPVGVRTQAEDEAVVEGSAPSAPTMPNLFRKVLATTAISLVVYAGFYWLVELSGLSLDDIPFLPDMRPPDWHPNGQG